MKTALNLTPFIQRFKSPSENHPLAALLSTVAAQALFRGARALALVALGVLLLAPAAAQAQTICTVDSLADSGPHTLRARIADSSCNIINFSVQGTIALTSGQLTINRNLTIMGPGANVLTVRRDSSASRFGIFVVTSGQTVAISGLTISGGASSVGGGIDNFGTLTLNNCTVSGNSSRNGGGGIYNRGTLTLNNSAVSNNTTACCCGGGISNDGSLTLNNSTVSDNYAGYAGGGIENEGTVRINNSTVSGNTAAEEGGGIRNLAGTLIISNSTLSNNSCPVYAGGIVNYGTATISNNTMSGNVSEGGGGITNSGTLNLNGSIVVNSRTPYGTWLPDIYGQAPTGEYNLTGLDPLLGPLQDNGGPTKTHALLPGSPAINAGDPNFNDPNLPYDQRGNGFARVSGGRIDIGAYELWQNTAPVALSKNITVSAGAGCAATVTAAQVNNGSYDPDSDPITLSLDSNGPFALGSHTVTLTVTDSHGASSSATATVTVTNTDPSLGNYPNSTVTVGGSATITPSSPPSDNSSISSVTVTAPGFTGGFTVNAATGAVSITSASPVGGFLVTVTATDDCGAMTTKTFTLTVAADTCGITINPATLPQPYVAVPYVRILSASQSGNYTFSVSAGALPPGLQLVTALGVTSIAGLPTTPGAYSFTIKAKKNGTACEATRSYTVTIPATVAPILNCVMRNQNGTYTAKFGYHNSTGAAVTIPVGNNNYFTPGNQNRGQATVFQPGVMTNAFSVTFNANGSNLGVWFLRGPDGILRPVNITTATLGCP